MTLLMRGRVEGFFTLALVTAVLGVIDLCCLNPCVMPVRKIHLTRDRRVLASAQDSK